MLLHALSTLGLAAGIATASVDSTELRREELMAALRSGGYTILLRHARTDYSVKENPASIPPDRASQRNLSDAGVGDAKLMGVVFKKFGIPVSEILASPMFRTKETAEYALGTPTLTMVLRTFPTTGEQASLVAAVPNSGTNRVLVTHHFVIEKHVPGIRPGDVGESEAAVVRPTGDGHVELVGRITLADWTALAGLNAAATHGSPSRGGHHAPSASVSNGATVVIPDTPAGRLAQAYLRAFNSGDAEQMRAFIETSMVVDASRPTETRLQSFAKLFAENGLITVATIQGSEDNEVVLGARSKRGDFRLTIKASGEQAGRAASISFAFVEGGHS